MKLKWTGGNPKSSHGRVFFPGAQYNVDDGLGKELLKVKGFQQIEVPSATQEKAEQAPAAEEPAQDQEEQPEALPEENAEEGNPEEKAEQAPAAEEPAQSEKEAAWAKRLEDEIDLWPVKEAPQNLASVTDKEFLAYVKEHAEKKGTQRAAEKRLEELEGF